MKKLIQLLLDTEEGISEEAYAALLDYLASIEEFGLLEDINNNVKSCNGRRYSLSIAS